jgi:hypothetical protein
LKLQVTWSKKGCDMKFKRKQQKQTSPNCWSELLNLKKVIRKHNITLHYTSQVTFYENFKLNYIFTFSNEIIILIIFKDQNLKSYQQQRID